MKLRKAIQAVVVGAVIGGAPTLAVAIGPVSFDDYTVGSSAITVGACPTGYACSGTVSEAGFLMRTVASTTTDDKFVQTIIFDGEDNQTGSRKDANAMAGNLFSDESWVNLKHGTVGVADKNSMVADNAADKEDFTSIAIIQTDDMKAMSDLKVDLFQQVGGTDNNKLYADTFTFKHNMIMPNASGLSVKAMYAEVTINAGQTNTNTATQDTYDTSFAFRSYEVEGMMGAAFTGDDITLAEALAGKELAITDTILDTGMMTASGQTADDSELNFVLRQISGSYLTGDGQAALDAATIGSFTLGGEVETLQIQQDIAGLSGPAGNGMFSLSSFEVDGGGTAVSEYSYTLDDNSIILVTAVYGTIGDVTSPFTL